VSVPISIQLLLGDYEFLRAQIDLAAAGNEPVLITDPTGLRDLGGLGNNIFNPAFATADSIFRRFSFNSLTAGLRGNQEAFTGSLGTTLFDWSPSALGLSSMGYTIQGQPNLFGVAFNNDLNYAKTYGGFVQNPLQPSGWGYSTGTVLDYSVRGTTITDGNPRLISNLISNQADQNLLQVQDDPLSTPGGRLNPLTGPINPLPSSMYLASWGQYFDHGLDLLLKGVDGKVQVPILPGDEMYSQPGQSLTVSRSNTAHVSIQAGSTDSLMAAWGMVDNGLASFNPLTSGRPLPALANTGTLMLNGRLITFANASRAAVQAAINQQQQWTGVSASLSATNHLVLSPVGTESFNTISPQVDLSQNYGSDTSQRIYLLEYTMVGGKPTATGNLLNQSVDGTVNLGASGFGSMPRWADIKANAVRLGLRLHDYNVADTPQIKTNADGTVWLDPATNTARFLAVNNTSGALVEITDTARNLLAAADLTLLTAGHSFLNDRGLFSLASDGAGLGGFPFSLTAAGDNPDGYDAAMVSYFSTNGYGRFQPLASHVIAGDARVNENIGLTGIHDIWHAEHNRNVATIKSTFGLVPNLIAGMWDGTYTAFAEPGVRASFPGAPVAEVWTGEMLFQAAKLITEATYQHFNFEEYIRKISPNIGDFQGYNISLDASISAEFASAVYRFGHSMLGETISFKDSRGVLTQRNLLDAFLNPTSYAINTAAQLARGTTQQVGNEIDEWITDALRNHLAGQKLDLATANLVRGRDAGVPSLNDVRHSLFQQTGMPDLYPYASWSEFGDNLLRGQHSLKEFIMAYAHADILTRYYNHIPGRPGVTKPLSNSLAGWKAFQLDPTKASIPGVVGSDGFYSGPGGVFPTLGAYEEALSIAADLAMADAIWMGPEGNQDFWNIDLWSGGLAEAKAPGSMLGSTMDAVFSIQMSNLQSGDRFYYVNRLGAAQNILSALEEITLADIVMRNTGATHLYSDVFSVPDAVLEIANYQDSLGNPLAGTTYASGAAMKAAGAMAGWVLTTGGGWTFTGNSGDYTDARGVINPNGSGNASELISGTNLAERINGLGGNETIWADGGNDTVQGGTGNDFLHGGEGNDNISDLAGDDLIWGDGGDDLIRAGSGLDRVVGGGGNDTIYGGQGADASLNGNDGHDLIYGGDGTRLGGVLDPTDGADWIAGGRGNDTLYGGAGNDRIDGGEGDDWIYGGIDNNQLDGFNGDDRFIVDPTQFGYQNSFSGGLGFDSVDYRASSGQIVASVRRGITIDLGNVGAGIVIPAGRTVKDVFLSIEGVWGSIYGDTITAATAIQVDALGNPILDTVGLPLPVNAYLNGWSGNDSLIGSAGNDTIDGGIGVDTMAGLLGDDWYYVDLATDVVVELEDEGIDTILAAVDYELIDEIENLFMLDGAFIGTGNSLDNMISGNNGDNVIDGGRGVDTLLGGMGNDLYLVDSLFDVIREAPAEGEDTVLSATSYILDWNLENLTLIAGNGGSATGNSGDNVLAGYTGNDQLSGLAGADTLLGLDGNDSLDGGLGIDSMVGGLGNDVYRVDVAEDWIVEDGAAGFDTVNSFVSYALSANLEVLNLLGAALNGTGSIDSNSIYGNGASNVLTGLAGHDTLVGLEGDDTLVGGTGVDRMLGGLGNDYYNVDSDLDRVIELAGGGIDTVNTSANIVLAAEVENVILRNPAVRAIGNALANSMTGTLANNTLDGGLGDDTLVGLAGDDTYIVDSTMDVVVENASAGMDTVVSSVNFSLASNLENLTLVGSALSGIGNTLDNVISGNDGNNTLNGGAGNDRLIGGAGLDRFVFNTVLGVANVDRILDFAIGDLIELDRSVFSALSIGATLTAAEFRIGAGVVSVANALQRILLDTNTGDLRYDHDGNSATAAMLFANVSSAAPLTAASFALTGAPPPPPRPMVIGGTVNADTLSGADSNDSISGLVGNDSLNGAAGNDTLLGGSGVDTLVGGLGADTFLFDATGIANSDRLADFSVAQGDRIALNASVFLGIATPGTTLAAIQLNAGAGEVRANRNETRIIYNTTTGALFWDQDGARNIFAPIQFAVVNPVPALTNTQFVLV